MRTPFERLTDRIWVKREDRQRGGSFKTRGVANVVLSAPADDRERGVVCVSSGNTALALAQFMKENGGKCHAFVPAGTDPRKLASLARAGISVVRVGGDFTAAAREASRFARDHGLVFCSPGASWQFSYGVGTVGLELSPYVKNVDTVYVPVGGGGLATGVGLALAGVDPESRPRLVGVQVEESPYVYEVFHSGAKSAGRESYASVADALVGPVEPGATILEVAGDVFSDVVLVSDDEIVRAQRRLAAHRIAVEPSAAAGLAAAARRDPRERSCVILTGKL